MKKISYDQIKKIFVVGGNVFPKLVGDELKDALRELTPTGSISAMSSAEASAVIRKLKKMLRDKPLNSQQRFIFHIWVRKDGLAKNPKFLTNYLQSRKSWNVKSLADVTHATGIKIVASLFKMMENMGIKINLKNKYEKNATAEKKGA